MTTTLLNPSINDNCIATLTDSYKYSHRRQLPPDATYISEYFEARGGPYAYSRFFGLQAICKKHLLQRVTHKDIDIVKVIVELHGIPFDDVGWRIIIDKYDGYLPVEIYAVPEGTDVPVGNVLMRVINTAPELVWLPTFLETVLSQVWAPTTVCTVSSQVREIFLKDLERSCEDPAANIGFKLHDFALRGVPTMGTGAALGLGHLVNFMGTDTVPALIEAIKYYNETTVVGFTIPAGEHSEILAWGPDGEANYFKNLFDEFLLPEKMVAAPIDTYDMENCLETTIGGTFRDRILNSGGTFVARPDSGNPLEIVPQVLQSLAKNFGTTTNSKGYKVLHPSVRCIFGDGMNIEKIKATNQAVMAAGFSVENVTYGMGAGLLQKIDRDIQRFAMKASAVKRDGKWMNIKKTVKTDPSKASKAGQLALVHNHEWTDHSAGNTEWETVTFENLGGRKDELQLVYKNGHLLIDESFATIRERALSQKH